MKLYGHITSGGAEYYGVKHIEGSDELDITGTIMRTDGGELEIFTSKLEEFGIKLVIN